MSSTLTIYGTLHFPPGALARWRELDLDRGDAEPDDHGEIEGTFAQPCEETSVAAVLASDDDRHHFVRLDVDGDRLHVRAALGDDTWAPWCGRISALARAAARVGAHGHLEAEDDGFYTGCLSVEDGAATFEPRSLHRPGPTDQAGAADLARIWDEELRAAAARKTAKKPTSTTARKTSANKKTAKEKAASNKSANKKPASKKTAKKTARNKSANKTAAK
jgi:hypothetical protein